MLTRNYRPDDIGDSHLRFLKFDGLYHWESWMMIANQVPRLVTHDLGLNVTSPKYDLGPKWSDIWNSIVFRRDAISNCVRLFNFLQTFL